MAWARLPPSLVRCIATFGAGAHLDGLCRALRTALDPLRDARLVRGPRGLLVAPHHPLLRPAPSQPNALPQGLPERLVSWPDLARVIDTARHTLRALGRIEWTSDVALRGGLECCATGPYVRRYQYKWTSTGIVGDYGMRSTWSVVREQPEHVSAATRRLWAEAPTAVRVLKAPSSHHDPNRADTRCVVRYQRDGVGGDGCLTIQSPATVSVALKWCDALGATVRESADRVCAAIAAHCPRDKMRGRLNGFAHNLQRRRPRLANELRQRALAYPAAAFGPSTTWSSVCA